MWGAESPGESRLGRQFEMAKQKDGPLAAALQKVSVSELWRLRRWAGEPGKSCGVPYRPEDRRASGSVFLGRDGLERFHDFKAGETYDAPGLLAVVEGIDGREACRRFIEIAEVRAEDWKSAAPVRRRSPVPRVTVPESQTRTKPELPPARDLTAEEIARLAELRGLTEAGVEFAAMLGLVKRVEWSGEPSWMICDSLGWNAQVRRFDGRPFILSDGREVKSFGIPGSWGSYPIGLPSVREVERVLLVEGVPDLVAACDFIVSEGAELECAAVCMTGASLWIPGEALAELRGKRVRIFPHVGDSTGAGEAAGLRWQTQIRGAGASAHCFDLGGLVLPDGRPVSDLNDAANLSAEVRAGLGRVSIF